MIVIANEVEAEEWALKHRISRVEIGYEMTSADEGFEWVKLSQMEWGKVTSKIFVTTHTFNKLFDCGCEWKHARQIAWLKDELRAAAEKKNREDRKRKAEIASLRRLQAKYPEETI